MKVLTTLFAALMIAVFTIPQAEAGPGDREARQGARGQQGAGQQGKGRRGRRHRGKRLFKKLDQNEDGSLSQDEVPEKLWTRLSKADADESGSVSADELKAAHKARRAKIAALDTNKDGELGQDEVSAEVWEKISAADKDGNGAVSKAEGKRARRQRRGKRRFKKADANGDGAISQDEVSAEIWERLSKADADGEGSVTKEERKAARKGRAGKRGGKRRDGQDRGGRKARSR